MSAMKNEQNLKELLDVLISCSPDAYVVTDSSGRVVFVNKTVEKLTGWSPDELIGKDARKFYLLPEGKEKMSLTEDVEVRSEPGILFCKDGKKITLSARQVDVENFQDRKGYLTIFYTGLKSDHHKDNAKDGFVSTVSHELRTPLTSIKGFADTLLRAGDKLTQENQRKYLTIIKEQADRLTRLVEDLLAVSRLESHKLQLTIRAIDLKKTIDKVCDLLGTKSANHIIIQEIEENIPQVWADADRLEQILTNLVDNAIKYSPVESKVTVNVTSLLNEQGVKDKLKIEIRDQGVGISEKDLPKIFTKFGRLDNPLTRQTQGTGLGLFITKSLVLALKGEILVKSNPGETIFTVILPAVITNPAIPLSGTVATNYGDKERE